MRAFTMGERFMDVESGAKKEGVYLPVFCESYLYDTVGKENARFILAIAEEYDALICFLGEKVVMTILDQWKKKEVPDGQ